MVRVARGRALRRTSHQALAQTRGFLEFTLLAMWMLSLGLLDADMC
jgi:hypothetical protein